MSLTIMNEKTLSKITQIYDQIVEQTISLSFSASLRLCARLFLKETNHV